MVKIDNEYKVMVVDRYPLLHQYHPPQKYDFAINSLSDLESPSSVVFRAYDKHKSHSIFWLIAILGSLIPLFFSYNYYHYRKNTKPFKLAFIFFALIIYALTLWISMLAFVISIIVITVRYGC
jgi:hypothetical protein